VFSKESAAYGIESGLVIGLCIRAPPSYTIRRLNRATTALDQWSAERRLRIVGQVAIVGEVLSRTVRQFLNEQELPFPAPTMKLKRREREIRTLTAAGNSSREIAATLRIAEITVGMHVARTLSKMAR
jgi:DNA-binding NarL/FixJ family response regulator